ncbi:DUF4262 domain-containing protein [Stenotrophomonas sp. PUT21]|uniref:DUF4262 domain-containing protein n=1 Tax=Stenotrophomonas sp. PUT21 TaxID=3456954 RepID=UPI003FCE7E41
MSNRSEALEKIRENIARDGCHVYVVAASDTPRFAYSVGASPCAGYEVILAGAAYYSDAEAGRIINAMVEALPIKSTSSEEIVLERLGEFRLGLVDSSWVQKLMLGAVDFYGDVSARQILPVGVCWTADIPDLSRPYDEERSPAWGDKQARHAAVPMAAVAVTNLDALRGHPVTEAARWEEGLWEMFAGAGPDVSPEDVRKIPLRTLVAIDRSLEPVMQLRVGEALWRDADELVWNEWKPT